MCSDENAIKLLTATLTLTSNVTKRIDSKIDEEERRHKLIEVQNMLGLELLAPAREFIRDGTLCKICHTGRKGESSLVIRYHAEPSSSSLYACFRLLLRSVYG